MKRMEQEKRLEAMLFAAGEPVHYSRLASIIGEDAETVRRILRRLADSYEENDSALDITELDGHWQICTRHQYANDIKTLLDTTRDTVLSPAALEVLALVAYNQPVTRAFIDQVRGVDSSHTLQRLIQIDLVEEAGRLELPGRPISYKTSLHFLRSFGIGNIQELPSVQVLEGPQRQEAQNEEDE